MLKLFLTPTFILFSQIFYAQPQPANVRQKDNANWIENFRVFRDAIFQKNKPVVKEFIDFPIRNENNEIWYLAYNQNQKSIDKLGATIKPFTEQDFEKYFDKLFSPYFIKCILKIKTDELFKKGSFSTPKQQDSSTQTSYRIIADFDKEEKSLQLNLSSNTLTKDKNGDILDGGELSIIYYFKVLSNGHIKLLQVRIAG